MRLDQSLRTATDHQSHKRVIYVGDPMYSWCYGIAPVVEALQHYCDQQGIAFEMIVGGLRSGGRAQWNQNFREFLAQEWQKIAIKTGQQFRFEILDLDYFDYNTEPSCRAIVTAKMLLAPDNQKVLIHFLSALQKKFYFENEDPKDPQFYQSICIELDMDFDLFKQTFESDNAKEKTSAEFQYRSELGVNSFPSFLMVKDQQISLLTAGYTSLQSLIRKIEHR